MSLAGAAAVRGAGLIEVLVAMLLVALASIGLMQLQHSASVAGQEAWQRTLAVALAQDILARIQANAGELAGYQVSNFGASHQLTATVGGGDCRLSPCLPAARREADFQHWQQVLAGEGERRGGQAVRRLPDAITCIDVNGARVTISVAWRGAYREFTQASASCGQGLFGSGDRQRRLQILTGLVAGL